MLTITSHVATIQTKKNKKKVNIKLCIWTQRLTLNVNNNSHRKSRTRSSRSGELVVVVVVVVVAVGGGGGGGERGGEAAAAAATATVAVAVVCGGGGWLRCLRPQQKASVFQGWTCSGNSTCCHTGSTLLSSSHCVLTPGQLIPALTQGHQVSSRQATRTPQSHRTSRVQRQVCCTQHTWIAARPAKGQQQQQQ